MQLLRSKRKQKSGMVVYQQGRQKSRGSRFKAILSYAGIPGKHRLHETPSDKYIKYKPKARKTALACYW